MQMGQNRVQSQSQAMAQGLSLRDSLMQNAIANQQLLQSPWLLQQEAQNRLATIQSTQRNTNKQTSQTKNKGNQTSIEQRYDPNVGIVDPTKRVPNAPTTQQVGASTLVDSKGNSAVIPDGQTRKNPKTGRLERFSQKTGTWNIVF